MRWTGFVTAAVVYTSALLGFSGARAQEKGAPPAAALANPDRFTAEELLRGGFQAIGYSGAELDSAVGKALEKMNSLPGKHRQDYLALASRLPEYAQRHEQAQKTYFAELADTTSALRTAKDFKDPVLDLPRETVGLEVINGCFGLAKSMGTVQGTQIRSRYDYAAPSDSYLNASGKAPPDEKRRFAAFVATQQAVVQERCEEQGLGPVATLDSVAAIPDDFKRGRNELSMKRLGKLMTGAYNYDYDQEKARRAENAALQQINTHIRDKAAIPMRQEGELPGGELKFIPIRETGKRLREMEKNGTFDMKDFMSENPKPETLETVRKILAEEYAREAAKGRGGPQR